MIILNSKECIIVHLHTWQATHGHVPVTQEPLHVAYTTLGFTYRHLGHYLPSIDLFSTDHTWDLLHVLPQTLESLEKRSGSIKILLKGVMN